MRNRVAGLARELRRDLVQREAQVRRGGDERRIGHRHGRHGPRDQHEAQASPPASNSITPVSPVQPTAASGSRSAANARLY